MAGRVVADLSEQNYASLFSKGQIDWYVDDTCVYRVTIHKTFEGNLTTKPINGALFFFDPCSGQLFLKVIHTSVWNLKQRIGQLAKIKTAEETSALIRALPTEERPARIIAAREGIREPLKTHLADFPDIIITGSELFLPFQALLTHHRFNDLVLKSTEPRMLLFNIYDEWLKTISTFTAFSRLVLILRALHSNKTEANAILFPDPIDPNQQNTPSTKVWPNFTDTEWITAEIALKNIIIADYCKRNNVTAESLSNMDIRDVVLRGQVKPKST